LAPREVPKAGVYHRAVRDLVQTTPHAAAPVVGNPLSTPLKRAALLGHVAGLGGIPLRYYKTVNQMFSSEARTRNIRVSVRAQYDRSRSNPQQSQWFFLYTVSIANEGHDTVQLISRHWVITDGMGEVQEVQGPGVVGEQPVLAPGQSFEYTSGCPLTTPFGAMHGTYQMINRIGEKFDIEIAPFTLTESSNTVN
jgi:ApaG protein